jgi:hypothetical protein
MQMVRRRTPQLGTRTLDVLHVASAQKLQPDVFCTFDRNQEKLARAEGLLVAQQVYVRPDNAQAMRLVEQRKRYRDGSVHFRRLAIK